MGLARRGARAGVRTEGSRSAPWGAALGCQDRFGASPVLVLEDDHQRPIRRDAGEEPADRVVAAALLGFGLEDSTKTATTIASTATTSSAPRRSSDGCMPRPRWGLSVAAVDSQAAPRAPRIERYNNRNATGRQRFLINSKSARC